ncbi:UDP-2,4-diacetamido-2,4,6-trideoxy-beta-L-altropyranose hydrolase [Paenibacillus cellulosilyticus]|uniref:UDP-2,4-diacetamido-2,4, 6-trideoxy-beta-L-altropyranose hydrolase n=2 Tax=Paenibacillus cellulosilyticus TaxID=375489 RepID=A0A2V2Z240_9BACL|nr:UDP-2,4-diacetamido-2,4,6-trideoxy-beta-L-altropyranose hydrolase [Paenibacillus cellulosilyticus]
MRCLTLAERLRKTGAEVSFICRELPGHLASLAAAHGYDVHMLPFIKSPEASSVEGFVEALQRDKMQDLVYTQELLRQFNTIDWLVVDHYALDEEWEKGIRPYAERVFVIDDMANRHHDCDALLDQNFHADMDSRYDGLVPDPCIRLLGPRYLLLREEFRNPLFGRRARDGTIHRVLVFFGGSDPTNETIKTLDAIEMLNRQDIAYDVVVGQGNANKDQIEVRCANMPGVNYYYQVDYMAELMEKADFAIGAGGATTWERCYLGLPAMVIALAENQREGVEELAPYGAFMNLGWHGDISSAELGAHMDYVYNHPELVKEMGMKARRLVQTDGTAAIKDIEAVFYRK